MAVDLKRMRALAQRLHDTTEVAAKGPQASRSWYSIKAAADATTEVYIYDGIGEWGITAAEFAMELKAAGGERVDIHINCEGGSVFEGLGIYESLRQLPAYKTAKIDGLAASAASFIAMACDRIEMGKRSRLMIHDAAGGCLGTANDMRETADLLDDLSNNMAEIYADRAGGTVEEWRARMQAGTANSGTWFDADRAIELGLADGTIGEQPTEPAAELTTKPQSALDFDALVAHLKGAFN